MAFALEKILIWIIIIGIAIILGFLTIKYVPALFQGKITTFEREKIPAVAPITPLNQEEFNEGSVSPLEETGTGVEMIFEEEVVVPKLKILDTPTDWLRVRKGPGATYPEITKVYLNEQYEYTDKQNG